MCTSTGRPSPALPPATSPLSSCKLLGDSPSRLAGTETASSLENSQGEILQSPEYANSFSLADPIDFLTTSIQGVFLTGTLKQFKVSAGK